MTAFILTSLIASVVLTLGLNLLPALFPKTAAKAEQKLRDTIERQQTDRLNPNTPKLRVFFPWKTMLVGSLALTCLVNVIAAFAR